MRGRGATQIRPAAMKVTVYSWFGVLFTIAGVIALVHPNFTLPGKKDEVMIANQKVIMETNRIISIPRVASGTEVVLGIGMIVFGSRKPRQR
jgi:hypothetical protein